MTKVLKILAYVCPKINAHKRYTQCQVCLQWLHWIQFCGQIKLGRAAEDKFALGMFAVMIAAPELNCKYERELCHS